MILFLDFDGVLHPFSRPTGPLVLVPRLERVLRDYPDVQVVISSAWRGVHTLHELRSFFSADIAARIIGVTPLLGIPDDTGIREMEIRAWLCAADREGEQWVALDDIPWFFSPNCANLVWVDGETGFNSYAERELRKRFRAEIK
jgi:hypothetical protein